MTKKISEIIKVVFTQTHSLVCVCVCACRSIFAFQTDSKKGRCTDRASSVHGWGGGVNTLLKQQIFMAVSLLQSCNHSKILSQDSIIVCVYKKVRMLIVLQLISRPELICGIKKVSFSFFFF